MLTRLLLLLGFSVLLTVALAYVIGFGFFLLGCLFPVKSAVRHLLMAFAPAEIQVDRIADPSLPDRPGNEPRPRQSGGVGYRDRRRRDPGGGHKLQRRAR